MKTRIEIVQRESISGNLVDLYSCVVDGKMLTEAETLSNIFLCLTNQKSWDY